LFGSYRADKHTDKQTDKTPLKTSSSDPRGG